jgi:C4-dicarboxylate transporter, DctM subunit
MMGTIIATMFGLLFGALSGGIWVGFTLAMTGTLLLFLFRDIPLDRLVAQYAWNILTTQELLALPLFILMGEILFKTRISGMLFKGLAPWAALLPGRLLHVNVIGCSIFAAISGSSVATTQVVGRVTLSELILRGYSKEVAMGSLAGAGTLGFLIPPSNIMIIYGVLGNVSILKLFAAGLIPGLLLACCFIAWIMIHATWRKDIVPASETALRLISWYDRFVALRHLAPVVVLMSIVLGSMYGGIATPSEGGAVGVIGALLIAAFQRDLTIPKLKEVALGSVITCSMIALIVLGASILGSAAAFLGVAQATADLVRNLQLSPYVLLLILFAFYVLLGCFLEGYSMIVMTLPVVLPIVKVAGFNPVWFGIFIVLVVEIAQIHPPIGFNLFVIQGLTDEKLSKITKATFPYLMIMAIFTAIVATFPEIALWLPNHLEN